VHGGESATSEAGLEGTERRIMPIRLVFSVAVELAVSSRAIRDVEAEHSGGLAGAMGTLPEPKAGPLEEHLLICCGLSGSGARGVLTKAMPSHADAQSFDVRHAESLVAALDLLVHHVFDVAVVDLDLPDSQGLDTLLTIQRHAPKLPVIVLTGLDDESVALSAVQQDAQDSPI